MQAVRDALHTSPWWFLALSFRQKYGKGYEYIDMSQLWNIMRVAASAGDLYKHKGRLT